MPGLELYENKVRGDAELPIQLSVDRADKSCEVFSGHWHEQLELHYIVQGGGDFRLGQQSIHVSEGDLLISNRNEFHSGYSTQIPYMSNVIIFDMGDLSQELAKKNYVFQSVIRGDGVIHDLIQRIFAEAKGQESGYKQLCKALVTELFVYLCRNYVTEMMPERDSAKRKKDLERLNAVLGYIEANYNQRITVEQLADMVCLSEDRFGHLLREGVGQPPLQYINAMRLRKALNMLKTNQYTVTEVADAVGFRDYNHFGRLFRKQYGCTPNEIKRGTIEKYSGNV
jgi:AraC-like DNA-binding protein